MRYGLCHFHLTGGEPLVHPSFTDVVRIIRDSGHEFSIVTNLSAATQTLLQIVENSGDSLLRPSASSSLAQRLMVDSKSGIGV